MTIDPEWDQHHRAVRHRLSWTGLVANGAPIVTILGGAAQSDTFLSVVYTMTVPLALFGIGAGAGLIAEEVSLKGDIEWKQGSAWWEDEAGPVKESVRINQRLREMQADGKLHLPSSAAEFLELASRGKEVAGQALREGPKATERVRLSMRLNRRAAILRAVSLGLSAGGFSAILAVANPAVREALRSLAASA